MYLQSASTETINGAITGLDTLSVYDARSIYVPRQCLALEQETIICFEEDWRVLMPETLADSYDDLPAYGQALIDRRMTLEGSLHTAIIMKDESETLFRQLCIQNITDHSVEWTELENARKCVSKANTMYNRAIKTVINTEADLVFAGLRSAPYLALKECRSGQALEVSDGKGFCDPAPYEF